MSRDPGTALFVPAEGAWDVEAALTTLAIHAIPGVERADTAAATHTRPLTVDGTSRLVRVHLTPAGVHADLLDGGPPVSDAQLRERVAAWFDLDANMAIIDGHLARGRLATLVRDRPGVRITRFVDPFEAAIATVIGQQVSLAAGRRFLGRLAAAYGDPAAGGLRSFPSPERLAEEPPERLRDTVGLTQARAGTVCAVAALFSGGFTLAPETMHELGEVRGVGPWTLTYLAIRALHEPDAYPATDAVLIRTVAQLAHTSHPVEDWAPYRSYAAARLWAHATPS